MMEHGTGGIMTGQEREAAWRELRMGQTNAAKNTGWDWQANIDRERERRREVAAREREQMDSAMLQLYLRGVACGWALGVLMAALGLLLWNL